MAIKVNGTTVINDSRALQNIASIDTATKNAMAAGGVGGLSTLVAEDATFGTGHVIKLSLGDYTQQTFWISNIKATGNSVARLRLSDSSDVTLTGGSDYLNQLYAPNSNSFSKNEVNSRVDWNGINSSTTAETTKNMSARITVWNAYNSSIRTTFQAETTHTDLSGISSYWRLIGGNMGVAQRNQSLVFYHSGSAVDYVSGPTTYTSIGVN